MIVENYIDLERKNLTYVRQSDIMDGIIFDVDGTLWDSTDVVAKSWNQAILDHSDLDFHVDGKLLKNLFGLPMDKLYDALFPFLPMDKRWELGTYCFEYENEFLKTEPGVLYQGVEETMRTLSKKTDLYIVSNCQCGYIELFLQGSGLSDIIKDHLCFGDTGTSKGQTILKLMEKNHLKDVVYVGDTTGDFEACKEAGIPFIFAAYGFGSVEDAPKSISQFSELLQIIR